MAALQLTCVDFFFFLLLELSEGNLVSKFQTRRNRRNLTEKETEFLIYIL